MPTRRAAPPKKELSKSMENSEGDNDFSLSQQSNSGEEQKEQFVELIKKHYAATIEKENARKEKKLLESAQKDLDVRAEFAPVINDAVKEVECVYTKFLLDYAACEDKIQAIWAYIQQKQEELVKMVEHEMEKDQEVLSSNSFAVFPGIPKMKASHKAFNTTVEHLNGLLYSEDSECDPQDSS